MESKNALTEYEYLNRADAACNLLLGTIGTGAMAIDDPSPDVVGPDAAIEIEHGAHVVTAEAVVAGKAETGQKVVVADYQKFIKGLVAAEVLADQGKEVMVIQPLPVGVISSGTYNVDGATIGMQMMNLAIKNVRRVSDFEVKKVLPGKVVIRNIFTEADEELAADTVVTSYWRKADDGLYKDLRGKVQELHKIGDCLAPRRTINAIYEGYKVAMEICRHFRIAMERGCGEPQIAAFAFQY
jgi:hypothetical protein